MITNAIAGERLLLSVPLNTATLSASRADESGTDPQHRLAAGKSVKGTVAAVNPLDVEVHLPRGES